MREWIALIAVLGAACTDGAGPERGIEPSGPKGIPRPAAGPTTSVRFRVCTDLVPEDVGVLSGSNDWVTLSANASGEFTAEVTERVAIRYTRNLATHQPYLQTTVVFLTATELAQLECASVWGRDHIRADGVPLATDPRFAWIRATGASSYRVSIGGAHHSITGGALTRIGPFPSGPIDLIAVGTRTGESVPRFLIRRDLELAPDDTLQPLDFMDASVGLVEQHQLSIPLVSHCLVAIIGGGSTDFRSLIASPAQLPAIPESSLRAGELHVLRCTGEAKTAYHHYRAGAGMTLGSPTITNPPAIAPTKHETQLTIGPTDIYPDLLGVAFTYQQNLVNPGAGKRETHVLVTKTYLEEFRGDIVFSAVESLPFLPGDTAYAPIMAPIVAQGRPAIHFGARAKAGETTWSLTGLPVRCLEASGRCPE